MVKNLLCDYDLVKMSLKRVSCVIANWIFTSLFNMMKHLLAEETIEKAQVFGHDASKWKPALKTHIPSESIPMEYGGTGPSFTSGSKVPFEHFKNERQNERA